MQYLEKIFKKPSKAPLPGIKTSLLVQILVSVQNLK